MNLTKICINKEQNITIDTEELKKYIEKLENGKNIPDIEGLTITKIEENGEIVVDVQGVIKGDLNIRGIKVKKIKAKKVLGDIFAEGVTTLEEIEVEEGITGNLDIERTSVKKISANVVGSIWAEGVGTLKEINVTEGIINGDLDIRGTSIEFQSKILEKKKNGGLKIKGEISFGGDIKGIEQLCNNENLTIPGNLDIRGTSVKKINLKKVLGYINAKGVETLEEIEVEGIINGYLKIEGTSVKTITANVVGSIWAEGVSTLEKIDITEGEINGELDISGTSVEFQKKIIEKKKNGELEITGEITFGGNIEGIDQLCNDENLTIPGNLNIRGTNVEKLNLKKVLGNIWAEGVITLEEINVTEGIGGDLEIRGTSVKKITANVVGSIDARKVETLEEINVPEINGYLDISGTNVEKLNLKKVLCDIWANGVITLEEIEVEEGITGNLNIEGTNVKKISAKYVLGNINAKKVETLEEINIPEIGKKLIINGTKIKTIKAKKVLGDINATGLITLEEIEVEEEIGGSLFIIGTNVRKIKAKKVLGSINANGVITLEEIEVTEGIDGDLNVRGTSIEFQKKVLEKKKNGELKITGRIFYDKEAID